MKKIIYYILIFSYSLVHGQNNSLKVGVNPFTINAKAALEIESISKGFLPPRMNSLQQSAITDVLTPPTPEGLTVYNTDNKTVEVYNSSSFRGTTASGFYYNSNYDLTLNSNSNVNQVNYLNFSYTDSNGGTTIYNEFGNNFNLSDGTLTAPSTGWYSVSIAYQFEQATWDLSDICYTVFKVNSTNRFNIYNTMVAGNRILSYNNSMNIFLIKDQKFAPGISWVPTNTTSKKISFLSYSIVKL